MREMALFYTLAIIVEETAPAHFRKNYIWLISTIIIFISFFIWLLIVPLEYSALPCVVNILIWICKLTFLRKK